jgi:two-component system response regulator HydG
VTASSRFNAKYDKRITGAEDGTLKILMAHAWLGNVRELRNVVERAFIACEATCSPPIPAEHLAGRGHHRMERRSRRPHHPHRATPA